MSDLHDRLLKIGITAGSQETDRVQECRGCRHFLRLAGAAGADWGVCAHPEGTSHEPEGPRSGRLVFAHAGCGVWKPGEEPERREVSEADSLERLCEIVADLGSNMNAAAASVLAELAPFVERVDATLELLEQARELRSVRDAAEVAAGMRSEAGDD